MKKIFLTLLSLSLFTIAFAQRTLPEIKDGTKMMANVFVSGQEYPVAFTIKSAKAPVNIAWSLDGYGDGDFIVSEMGLNSGSAMYMAQPGIGTTKLSDTETYGLISKAAYKSLVDNKGFTYNGMKFKVKTDAPAMKIGGKEIDATAISTEDGKLQLWILNNPNLPLIVQTAGMPIDMVVTEIK
jgi:hypothetical protein